MKEETGLRQVRLRVEESRYAVRLCVEQVRVVPDTPIPEYTGATTVIPAVDAQTFETADTVLRDDISVQGIPFYTTTNQSGGYTAIIGG